MNDDLFDADEFGKTRTSRPRVATPPRSIETVAVMTDQTWLLVNSNQPGVVHAHAGRGRNGAMATFCGSIGVPRTFTDEVVQGCAACIRNGAKFRSPT